MHLYILFLHFMYKISYIPQEELCLTVLLRVGYFDRSLAPPATDEVDGGKSPDARVNSTDAGFAVS